MANYLLLYSGGGMPETEEENARVLQAWTDWYNRLGQAVVDPGNPFTQATKTVASNGMVTDGAVGTMATGYTIIQAGSLDAAADMAKGCPVLSSGGQVSVYETFQVMQS